MLHTMECTSIIHFFYPSVIGAQVAGMVGRAVFFFLRHAFYKFVEETLTSHGMSCAHIDVVTSTPSECLDRRVVSKVDPP